MSSQDLIVAMLPRLPKRTTLSQSIKYIVVTTVAIALTIVSALMTISGYLSLYAGRTLIVSSLFVVLEFAKATIFGIIFVYADKRNKIILLVLAIFLVCLSFIGHLSYLNNAYATNKTQATVSQEIVTQTKETHDTQLQDLDYQIQLIREQIQVGKDEIKTLNETATGLQTANSRNWAVSTNKKRIKEIQDQNIKLQQDIKDLYTQKKELLNDSLKSTKDSRTQTLEATTYSVFKHTADLIGITQDSLARAINFILALVIDTLALVMLWTAGEMWKQHRAQQNRASQARTHIINKATRELLDTELPAPSPTLTREPPTPQDDLPQTLDSDPEQFLFEGKSVDDVIGMTDLEVQALQKKVKTKAQRDWLSFALKRRKIYSDLQYEELK